jgi:stage II sporulation protein D
MRRLTLSFLALFFLFSQTVAYSNTAETIRVGLGSNLNQVVFSIEQGEYSLIDSSTKLPVGYPQKGEDWIIRREGISLKIVVEGVELDMPYSGPLILMPFNSSVQNIFRYSNVAYRDTLIIQNETDGLLVVNDVDIEKYLYGVVGKEMGYSAPLEALKAQAVASRSYALSNKGKNTRYDVGLDTSSQVYGGYSAELLPGAKAVKQAVDETAGQVLYYEDKLVNAFFHANAGGYTENSENVWIDSLPYIKATSSPYDEYAKSYQYQSGGWPANTYQWEVTYTREDLLNRINNWNNKSLNKIEIGEVVDLVISRKQHRSDEDTLSGRVTRLDFVGTKGEKSISKDSIRSVLGIKSTLFDLDFDSTVHILNEYGEKVKVSQSEKLFAITSDGLVSGLNDNGEEYTIIGLNGKHTIPVIFNKVIISGKGHGHGLGMSQWGAQGMAEAGYSYNEILELYYNQGKNNGSLTIEQLRIRR